MDLWSSYSFLFEPPAMISFFDVVFVAISDCVEAQGRAVEAKFFFPILACRWCSITVPHTINLSPVNFGSLDKNVKF